MPAVEGSGTAALEPSMKPIELSFPLPKALETKIHAHLTINTKSIVLFLTTVYDGDIPTGAPLGSFVYAIPDVSRIYLHNLVGILTFVEEPPWQYSLHPLIHL